MALEPPTLISRESPRSRRRQRRNQQQSSCCCCSIVVVSLVLVLIVWRGPLLGLLKREAASGPATGSAAFPLELSSDARSYLRYNLVRLTATVVTAAGEPTTLATPPEVIVRHNGEIVSTVGRVERLKLRFDRGRQVYQAWWPVPWNAAPGEYWAEARIPVADPEAWTWETPEQRRERLRARRRVKGQPEELAVSGESYCVAQVRIVINARPKADIPPGTCVATWEPDFRPSRIPRPQGGLGDWKTMFEWCQFMGADTFWFRGGVTEVYQGKLTDETPFKPYNIESIPALAAEARHRGLRFGAWAAAYTTYPKGNNRNKPDYQYAQDISRTTGAVRSLDFISLLEPKRIDHLAQFFNRLQADPNVDYLGLDYMRSDRGGYEMVDKFTSEMPVKLPEGFNQWSRTKRWQYVAGKIEREWQSDPNFYDSWNWWRAHTGAEIVRDIRAKGQLTKPLWIFVLSWWHGKQHGQDPLMFNDAGVSLLAPMLYQVSNRGQFDKMVGDWNKYLQAGQTNILPGDQVDFYWHQKTLRPAAPEEMYDRMISAHRNYEKGGLTVGCFWHDISRAATGSNLGPYPGTEWALAGGAAFTTVRNGWKVYPMVAELAAPAGHALSSAFTVQVKLENIVEREVKRLNLEIVPTAGVEAVGNGRKQVPSLGAGQSLSVPFTVRLKGANAARANRFMVALKVTWPEDDYGKSVRKDLPRQMIVMKYVQGR
jgi:hypothetical protein